MAAKELSFQDLIEAISGEGIAFRRITRLQPAGGTGDKIFPPTYEGGHYCSEQRRIDGKEVPCVLVDSVASQANRMELALQDAFYNGKDKESLVPFIVVDFPGAGVEGVPEITSLQAPHRIADAILRDSEYEGQLFEKSAPGQEFVHSTAGRAAGLLRYCPTALIFGMWHSTGILGGLGAKVQRALVSEVIAVNATMGRDVSSRMDPLGISSDINIYENSPPDGIDDLRWTLEEKDINGKPRKPYPSKSGKSGKASTINHSNVTPDVIKTNKKGEEIFRGITCDVVQQTTVLSLAALRRISVDNRQNPNQDRVAQAALAALGLVAATLLNRSEGFDLRSRCTLVPEHVGNWELIMADGTVNEFSINSTDARKFLEVAVEQVCSAGIGWQKSPIVLNPTGKLIKLIDKSREIEKSSSDKVV